jgi:hypothetical protein
MPSKREWAKRLAKMQEEMEWQDILPSRGRSRPITAAPTPARLVQNPEMLKWLKWLNPGG